MPYSKDQMRLALDTPATYRISVQGYLEDSWADRLAGMKIKIGSRMDQAPVTSLVGRLQDQVELVGVLNSLYELRLPILSVELISIE